MRSELKSSKMNDSLPVMDIRHSEKELRQFVQKNWIEQFKIISNSLSYLRLVM